MYRILMLNTVVPGSLESKVKRVTSALAVGDFKTAHVSKLRGQTDLYRAALDTKARLIFRLAHDQGAPCILILELLRNHEYEKSRFLRGFGVNEQSFEPVTSPPVLPKTPPMAFRYLHAARPIVHYLDRVLSFDDEQDAVLHTPTPLVIIGSAGSGKTVLTLEKMKELAGDILYVTHSAHLADTARRLFYAEGYENDVQTIDFLSFRELLETIRVPPGKEATYAQFKGLFERVKANFKLKDGHKVFEEIRGVITGTTTDRPYLSRADYLSLGIKQSIFLEEEREQVYAFFERYVQWLQETQMYDPNMLAYHYGQNAAKRYDFAVIDEVQDFTLVQLDLILRSLRQRDAFVMSGDSNQIVHPNFFSWAKIKSYFYDDASHTHRTFHILKSNYRNGSAVTAIGNKILLLKQRRFGSVDRESHFLVEARQHVAGDVQLVEPKASVLKELDQKTRRSTKACVVVLRDDLKSEAQKVFGTPLVFSIHEAKGLEYDTVILFNIVSAASPAFRTITEGMTTADVEGELVYGRAKDKGDKSADVYKFFINSLYVAVTRAVERLVLVEQDHTHRIFDLLGLTATHDGMTLQAQESSLEDWQKEARKLELQGRLDQAEQIRRDILRTVPVPWRTLTQETYPQISNEALNSVPRQKKSQHLLFEFAVTHGGFGLYDPLVQANYSYAKEVEKNRLYVHQKLYREAAKPHSKLFWDPVKLHGIEYRSPANETPLMAAVRGGGVDNVERLLALGADRDAVDNLGMTAFQKGLGDLIPSTTHARLLADHHASILPAVAPGFCRIKVGDKMTKLNASTIEYFLVNALAGTFLRFLRSQVSFSGSPSLTSALLEEGFKLLHPRILPEHRKRRTYLNAVLAKNTVGRQDPYNRLLFFRQSQGRYMINPLLEVDVGGQWRSFYDYLAFEKFRGFIPPGYEEWLQKMLPLYRQEAEKIQRWQQMPSS